MGVVALEREILEDEILEAAALGIQDHAGEGTALAGELLAGLVEVVVVKVEVAEGVDEVARAEVADLRDHHGEERVGGDVEGHAEEEVRAALVKLATQLAILHKKLEQRMAGRERHEVEFRRIPGRNDEAAAGGVFLDVGDDAGDLIDDGAIESAPGAPLRAIYSPEVAVFIGPLVPDRNFVFAEVGYVGLAFEEPQ